LVAKALFYGTRPQALQVFVIESGAFSDASEPPLGVESLLQATSNATAKAARRSQKR
jgi:hypothetical protein